MKASGKRRTLAAFALLLYWGLGTPAPAAEPKPPQVTRESVEAAYQPRRLALVVGINEFQDSNWRSLHYAVSDAQDMANELGDTEVGYFDQVIELTQPWETTTESILEALRQIANRDTSPEDVIFIYISTHGTLARDRNNQLHQYLVTCDTKFTDIPATALDIDTLTERFNKLVSRRKVLILAACHSGMGKSELPPDIEVELQHLKSGFFVKPIETASEASIMIGVSDWGETAQEDPGLKHDIYTYFFLEGMTKNDENQDGAVSLSEAHNYARRKTYYFTKGQQRPFAHSDVLGTDPIILSGAVTGRGKPVVFSYSDDLSGSLLKVNGEEKGALPDGFATEPGWNRVAAIDPQTGQDLYHGRVYVREGERLDIDRMIDRRNQPALGMVGSYRLMASEDLANDVLPSLPMYGMAYKVSGFPFTSTDLRLEATYGQSQWTADLDQGGKANVAANALQANVEWLFSRRVNQTDYFAGPVVGGLALFKDISSGPDQGQRQSSTVYPGVVAGVRFRLNPDLNLEIADRVTYNTFNVNDQTESALVNEITATVFFSPRALLLGK